MKRENMKRFYSIWLIFVALSLATGCREPEEVAAVQEVAAPASEVPKDPISRETTMGPVHAVVTLGDAHPVLGERVELTLRVEAAEGVIVTMPDFGDQLGRYEIADYKTSESILDDGRNAYEQRYFLELPRSGRLRTPTFLVEFVDNRDGAENRGKVQELLTEEMSFEASSVFAEGQEPPELFPAQGALGELVLPSKSRTSWWIWVVVVVACGGVIGGVVATRWGKKREVILPPDVVAISALDALQRREIPQDAKGVDAWYVDLSSIVRTYIEGRFELEAPRMTTEEFFELARGSQVLSESHKALIHRLLERSDRVKFTDYIPSREESEALLADARRFVEETQVVEEESHV